jgi:autoinducer 2-degrading protein
MLIVHIQIHVKPEFVDAFRQASIANARASVQEPGIARFEVLQRPDAPERFVFVEVYRTADAPAEHRATAHYAAWRDAVAEMMAEDRARVQLANVFPGDEGW